MKIQFLSSLALLILVTGCNSIFEVGIEHSPASTIELPANPTAEQVPTAIVSPTATTAATPPPSVAMVTEAAPVISSVTQPAPVNTSPQMVKIYMIAVDDNGQSGTLVGCGDSVVPVVVQIPATQGVLRAALEKLVSIKDQYYGQSGLYNALYQSDLKVESVSIDGNGKASVYLTGKLQMGGECDTPRVEAQLKQTVLQFQTVADVVIFINGKPLAEVLSLKG